MHRTVQVAEPQWSSRFATIPVQARLTRRAFVERHADSGTLIPGRPLSPSRLHREGRRRLPLHPAELTRTVTRRAPASARTTGAPPRAARRGGTRWLRRRSARRSGPRSAGLPGERPIGSIIAGWPVRLNHTVKGENANTRRQYSSTSPIIMSIQPSFAGAVARPGVSSTSQSAWNAAIWRPSRCACLRSRARSRRR